MRIARLEQMLNKAIEGADDIVFDENGEPLRFEREDAPKDKGQPRPGGKLDLSGQREWPRKYGETDLSSS